MRRYEIRNAGGLDGLVIADRPERPLGRGEVRVRIRAASLNYRDLMVAKGMFPGGLPENLVPLSDGAGEVVETGPDVTRVSVGDRVMPIFKQSWIGGEIEPADNATTLGGAIDGVLAERAVFDQSGLVHLPAGLSYAEGATLPCAAVTAWAAVQSARPVTAGDTVLVLGTGGVATFALQFARAAGARVIVTSSSDEKIERAKALGASDGVNYRTHADWGDKVRALTGGRGVDLVVETGGGGTIVQSIAATRLAGAISLVGVITQGLFDPLLIMRANLTVKGIGVGPRKDFEAMNRAIVVNDIRPVIDRTFAFEEAPEAFRYLEGGEHFGKIVITVGNDQ
jgi:NADPH:quinone reductase-like Zn-dependent oxidoreductase